MPLSDQLHVIVGLGVTGFSCARYLHDRGIPLAVTDSRRQPPQLAAFQQAFPDVPVALGELNADLLRQAACIVLSPGVALSEPPIAALYQQGIPLIGDIELFAQAVNAPVIAITGTNAKSTVTTLVGLMAQEAGYEVAMGGNLGVPALDLLKPSVGLYVLELSSFQLETTYSLQPQAATVLNVTPDHMDRYSDVAAYQQAKHRIYPHCRVAVCNRDDPLTEYIPQANQRVLHFTLQQPGVNEFGLIVNDQGTYLAFEQRLLLPVRDLPIPGAHYQTNALSALALGYGIGLPMESMLSVLRTFKGLPHRCQFVREYKGVKWYNDSKGTNVGATQAAIEGLGKEMIGKLVLIAGGVGKNADFHPLMPVISQYTRHVVLIGEAAAELASLMEHRVSFSFAASMEEAVSQAMQAAQPADSVLLSPACASFDMFKNYEHRGEVFTDIVQQLS